jgi:hypothetical protein
LQDKTGRTALHWAAECNQIEAAQTLIDYGCNVKALEGMGRWEHAVVWLPVAVENEQQQQQQQLCIA